jgi:hypothetical protein
VSVSRAEALIDPAFAERARHRLEMLRRVDLIEKHIVANQKRTLKVGPSEIMPLLGMSPPSKPPVPVQFSRLTLIAGCTIGELGLCIASIATLADFWLNPSALPQSSRVRVLQSGGVRCA